VNPGWNDALISREQAARLAGAEPVHWHWDRDIGGLLLRHTSCGKSCGLWMPGQPTTPDDVLSGVLRHLVMAHDLPLNHAARDQRKNDERTDGTGPSRDAGQLGSRPYPAPSADPGAGGGGGADDLGPEPRAAGAVGENQGP
jgi:hypothetical protein